MELSVDLGLHACQDESSRDFSHSVDGMCPMHGLNLVAHCCCLATQCRATLFGNGQLSLIFGVPNFCAFSRLVLCLFKLQVEAKKRKS